MSSKPNFFSLNLVNKFVKDNKKPQTFATIGKGNIYTNSTSNIAFLAQSSFYNIQIGTLITANGKVRHVLDKNPSDFSVTLNSSVNWDNNGLGYEFSYQNPVSQLLDNSKQIVGYVTSDGLLYLTKDVPGLKLDKIFSSDKGLKLLNQNNYGIYIDDQNNIYKGDDNTDTWELIETSSGTAPSGVSKGINSDITDIDTPFFWNTEEGMLYIEYEGVYVPAVNSFGSGGGSGGASITFGDNINIGAATTSFFWNEDEGMLYVRYDGVYVPAVNSFGSGGGTGGSTVIDGGTF